MVAGRDGDFGRLFRAYRRQFPFLVAGSDENSFKHRQVDVAQEWLGVQIEGLPGGLPALKSANLRVERIRRL
jgi:hypothetical protein